MEETCITKRKMLILASYRCPYTMHAMALCKGSVGGPVRPPTASHNTQIARH